MSRIALSGNASGTGTFTLASPNSNSDRTLNLPDNSGTVLTTGSTFAGTGPAFSAYASTNQTVSDGTATKILFDTEEFDTNSNFSSSRFTPTIAGYYQVNATVNCSQTAIVDFVIWIYKNNTQYKRGFGFAGTASKFIAPVSTLVYLNGSTDYVEVFIYSDGTGNATINASSQDVWFNGCLVRSA